MISATLLGNTVIDSQFSVPIIIKNRTGLDSFSIGLTYDSEALTFVEIVDGGATPFSTENKENEILIRWQNQAVDWVNDTLGFLTFRKNIAGLKTCSITLAWTNTSQFFANGSPTPNPAAFNDITLVFPDGAPIIECPANIEISGTGIIISDTDNFIQSIDLKECQTIEVGLRDISVLPDCDFLELRQDFDRLVTSKE